MDWISAALTASGAGAFRWDAEADIFEATPGLHRLLAIPPNESIRSLNAFLDHVDARDREHLEHAIRTAAADRSAFDGEFCILRPDDTRVWLWIRGSVPEDADRDTNVLGLCSDVTAQRRVRDELASQARIAVESEARLKALLEASPLGIDIMDLDGNPIFYNPKAAELHGFDVGEGGAQRWVQALHPEDRERVERTWREAATKGIPWEDTYRFVHDDGRVVWVSGRAAPIRVDGKHVGFVGTLEDVTALKASVAEHEESLRREQQARVNAERRAREEEALREATATLTRSSTTEEVIREIARNAVVATDADGAFIERIDIENDSVIIVAMEGKAVAASGGRIPYRGSLAQQVVESRQTVIVKRLSEAQHRLPKDLVRLHPDDTGVAVPLGNSGEPIGALILMRDYKKPAFNADELRRARTFADLAAIAFRKLQLLEDSEQRREEAERLMKSRARLMRGFSHDVRNPLGAADGFLGLLMEGVPSPLTEDQKAYVTRARNAIATSLGLIEDLLALARAETGQLEIEWEPVDVRDAARELGDQYSAKAKEKGLAMELHLPDNLPLIESDATRVRQVLGNLFSNAVKYTDQGSVDVTVSVRAAPDAPGRGEWIAIEVRDTGRGIPQEKQSALFKEFSRLEPEEEGAGIGLAISRYVARALGGEITVSSEPGKGSTFTLWLPCTRKAQA